MTEIVSETVKRNPFFQVSKDEIQLYGKSGELLWKKLRMIHFPLIFPIRKYRRIWMNSER